MPGLRSSSAETSAATCRASSAGVRPEEPTNRSVSQRKSSPCASSSMASSAMNPKVMRQYRLRNQTGSDISELVSRAPHGQHEFRFGGVVFELPADPLDERVDAPLRDVRVVSPHSLHQRI